MRRLMFVLALGASFTAGLSVDGLMSSPGPAPTHAEGYGAGLVNGSRLPAGKRLTYLERAAFVCARNHSVQMRREQTLRHSSTAALRACLPDAKIIGENVGFTESLNEAHQLMLRSESHRRNLYNSQWTYLGVGVDYDGAYWLTQIFWAR